MTSYWDWMIDLVYLFLPAQGKGGEFLKTFQEFPPRQKAASFTIDWVLHKLLGGAGSH